MDSPQWSHRKLMTTTSLKYGMLVRSSRVIPCDGKAKFHRHEARRQSGDRSCKAEKQGGGRTFSWQDMHRLSISWTAGPSSSPSPASMFSSLAPSAAATEPMEGKNLVGENVGKGEVEEWRLKSRREGGKDRPAAVSSKQPQPGQTFLRDGHTHGSAALGAVIFRISCLVGRESSQRGRGS